MGIESFKIAPGASLGPLVLGLSLPEIIKIITTHKSLVGTKAEFKYSNVNPLLFDYIIDLVNPTSHLHSDSNQSIPSPSTLNRRKPQQERPDVGHSQQKSSSSSSSPSTGNRPTIRLRFDSASQQLKMVAVDSLHTIHLSYRGMDFSSPNRVPNMKTILDILGPTKPGKLLNGVYELQYPGISMEFTISKEYHSKLKDSHDLPTNVPAPLTRIYIFRGDDSRNPKILRCPPEKDSQNRRGSFSSVREESVLSEKPKPQTVVTFQQGISSVQAGSYNSDDRENYLYSSQPHGVGHHQFVQSKGSQNPQGGGAQGLYQAGQHDVTGVNTNDDFVQLVVDADSNVNFCHLQKYLSFGNSSQDVMSILGKPEGIYFKEKGRLAIHNSEKDIDFDSPSGFSPSNPHNPLLPHPYNLNHNLNHNLNPHLNPNLNHNLNLNHPNNSPYFASDYSYYPDDNYSAPKDYDYFFNYFSAGLDILFDGKSHTVKKFVFHTNFPGQVDFNVYHKCFFRLEVPTERDLQRLQVDEDEAEPVGDLLGYPEFAPVKKSAKKKKKFTSLLDLLIITPDMRWEDIQRELGIKSKEKCGPLINSRVSAVNPFDSTRLYGYYNLIFDVMQNDHIASITIFDPSL